MQGAIDLASIMVGVIVIGVISGIIAATVFAVIPWAQDHSAMSNLDSVTVSESVHRVTDNSYFAYDSSGTSEYRAAETWDIGLQRPAARLIVDVNNCASAWIAAQKSATGAVFVKVGGDGASACVGTTPTGNDSTAVYKIPTTGAGANVIPAALTANLPSGIAATVPLALVDAIRTGSPYNFGAAFKPGRSPNTLPTYAGETILGWTSVSLAAMAAEESAFSVRNGMLSTYADFAGGASAFPTDYAEAAAQRQSALLIAWEPWDSTVSSATQPTYKPTAITAGNFDSYITSWLATAQTYAKTGTIMVRFAPEMNDSVRPWSAGQNGGTTPAEYIAMWKHVYAIKQATAPDVILVWNPLNFGASGYSITDMYPGSAYVDMLALDGFNWSDTRNPGVCNWQSFEDVFSAPITELKGLAGTKPWGIAEVASAPDKPADFATSGDCNSAWGWTVDWPANPPFEQTTADWVTQDGWTKMLFKKARAKGALFVNLFNIQKETDWRVSDTAGGQAVVSGAAGEAGWIAGDKNAAGFIKAAAK